MELALTSSVCRSGVLIDALRSRSNDRSTTTLISLCCSAFPSGFTLVLLTAVKFLSFWIIMGNTCKAVLT